LEPVRDDGVTLLLVGTPHEKGPASRGRTGGRVL